MNKVHCLAILLGVLLGLSCASCDIPKVRRSLETAETLIKTEPDSALRILGGISDDSVHSGRLRSRKSVLTAAAMDLCRIDDGSYLDQVRKAVDYFRNHGHRKDLIQAMYYYGDQLADAGFLEEAAWTFLSTSGLAAEEKDDHHCGLALKRLAIIHGRTGDVQGEVAYARQAAGHFMKADMPRLAISTRLLILNGLLELGDRGQAKEEAMKIIRFGEETKDSSLIESAKRLLEKKAVQPTLPNSSPSLERYIKTRRQLEASRNEYIIRERRFLAICSTLSLIIIALLIIVARKKHRQESARMDRLAAALESLSAKETDYLNIGLKALESLCEVYYQKDCPEEVKSIIDRYRAGGKSFEGLAAAVDDVHGHILSQLKLEMESISKDDLTLFTYLVSDFSYTAISVLMNIEKQALYNRVSRLRDRIAGSDCPHKEDFSAAIQRRSPING